MSAVRGFVLAAFALACAGCSAVGTYFADRGRDAIDIIDLRYGDGMGLGLQVDATMFFGTGLGYSKGEWTRTWYGRHAVDTDNAEFFGWLVSSEMNLATCMDNSADGWNNVLLFNFAILGRADWIGGEEWFAGRSRTVPGMETFRVGLALFVPGGHGGLYVNLGEIVDFLGGLATFDLANDDGVVKGPVPPPAPASGMPPRP